MLITIKIVQSRNMPKRFKINRYIKGRIKRIMNEIECSKDFVCYESNFRNVCNAKDIGLKSYLLCLEKQPQECNFSLFFVDEYLCKCPVRIYLAKKLKKQ